MASRRPNPFDAAFDEVGKAVEGAMKRVPPPQHIVEAVADFDRRLSDPAAAAELRAIINIKGEEEAARYISTMLREKETWGL